MVVWCYDQSPRGLELTFGITVVHQSSPHIYFFNTCIFTRNTKGFIKRISKSIDFIIYKKKKSCTNDNLNIPRPSGMYEKRIGPH